MPVVAYIANQFPSPLEPYIIDEIRELRRRGVQVIPCSARARPRIGVSRESLPEKWSRVRRVERDPTCSAPQRRNRLAQDGSPGPGWKSTESRRDDRDNRDDTDLLTPTLEDPQLTLQSLSVCAWLSGLWLLLSNAFLLRDAFRRILLEGSESPSRRIRCLVHTFLGACFAALLQPFHVEHIHAHHGYFSSWIAMVAARLLGVGFSLTLHGSDLLLHAAWLDTKLQNCDFCVTVSRYNRDYILRAFPLTAPSKIIVQHLGVDAVETRVKGGASPARCMILLSVGRLHPVKDHAFLVDACARLRDRSIDIFCLVAGEGHARRSLERQIAALGLEHRVTLLGHIPHDDLDAYYALADVVVLTSRSEGIPVVLMEAMARRKLVLAPAITGIPELVKDSVTGFLFRPGNLEDFVDRVEWLYESAHILDGVRDAAQHHVLTDFHRATNVRAFSDMFVTRMRRERANFHENPFLQQI